MSLSPNMAVGLAFIFAKGNWIPYYRLILEMSSLYKYNKNNLNGIQMCQGLIILR